LGAADALLVSIAPAARGRRCAAVLSDLRNHIPTFANLIRFETSGVVGCAAVPPPVDTGRAEREWFKKALAGGRPSVATAAGSLGAEPMIITSVSAGMGQGVMAAVIPLASIRPPTGSAIGPVGLEVAVTAVDGRILSSSQSGAFPPVMRPRDWRRDRHGVAAWTATDLHGERRIFAAAPLPGHDGEVVFSAPRRDVVSWGALNPLLAIGLPILAFALALAGVWVVADQSIVRWIAYLQRIAAIYARGRYGIHPALPDWAPPEIRDLAESLDAMAATVAARDRTLRENLVHKDALLREIHHRVKNNLQVISSLLNMQQRALADPAARAAISDTRQRISALALIYRALYEGPDLRKVDLRQFLEDLIGPLMVNDAGRRPTIRTTLSIDSLSIDPDQLAPLALFAVEAITNARKHGLGDAAGGSLDVTFRVREGGAELTIRDSGCPGGTPPVVGEGVGRTLMTAFARQLSGEVLFAAEGAGMTVRLNFPVSQARPEG
jgi:two-component sensor histidine kinase